MKTLLHSLLRAPLAGLALSLAACGGGSGPANTGGEPTFAKSYGGPARDQATAAVARPGGGYAFAGTLNNRGSGSGRIGGLLGDGREGDLWVTALDAFGDVQWQRSYGRASLLPAGALPTDVERDIQYLQVRAALDTENDGRRNGAWLVGRVSLPAPNVTPPGYSERGTDLLITRLDAASRVVFSRSYDSGPLRRPFYFSGEQTSEAWSSADIWPTADGGAVAVADAVATVNDNGDVVSEAALYVLKIDAAGNRQSSTLIPAEFRNRYDRVLVRAAPSGAVVAQATPAGMKVIWFDFSGGASIRWQRDFEGDEVPHALLVADDDGDGAPDGIVVAGIDQTLIANGVFGDHVDGFVIKLDTASGEQRWRRDFGTDASGLASTCGVSGAACRYAAAGEDRDGVLVRTLDVATGGTLAERKIADSTFSVGIRHIVSTDGFQLFTNVSSTLRDTRLVTLDATLGVSSAVAVEQSKLAGRSNLVPDAGGGHLALHVDKRLFALDALGGVSDIAALDGGETTLERGYTLQALPGSSGFVVAGEMSLRAADAVEVAAWVLRLDSDGGIAWQKRLDGFRMLDWQADFGEAADLLRTTPDGGFVIGGSSGRPDHYRVVKLRADGSIAWGTRALEPSGGGVLRVLRVAADGSMLIGGDSASRRAWLARLGANGEIQWTHDYAARPAGDPRTVDVPLAATDLRVTSDGGSLLVGTAARRVSLVQSPLGDAAAIRLDAQGAVLWAMRYPFGQAELRRNVRVAPSADGGFVIAASEQDRSDAAGRGRFNLLLFKIDANGAVVWSQRYGGLYDDIVHGIEPLPDGGFLISAQSDSFGDYSEAWVLRVGPDGRIVEGCNADRGRGGVVARPLSVTRQTHVLPDSAEATAPPVITPVDTHIVARQPNDVAAARQCFGSAGNDPGVPTASRTLTVRQLGESTGVVSSTPPGIVCGTAGGGVCSAAYAEGSLVSLRVDIASVRNFSAWGAGCESISGGFGEVCAVRLDADKTIDVIFSAAPPPPPPPPAGEFTLTVMIDRLGGFIGTTDGAIGCAVTAGQPRTCAARYAAGTSVDLYAASLPGGNVLLESWQGDCASFGARPNITLTMDRDYTCRAAFVSAP